MNLVLRLINHIAWLYGLIEILWYLLHTNVWKPCIRIVFGIFLYDVN